MGKFYAVRVGAKPGIYETWAECERQVKGYKGAIYKSFPNMQDAINFVNEVPQVDTVKKEQNQAKDKASSSEANSKKPVTLAEVRDAFCNDSIPFPKAYVDGSYIDGRFSYGVIFMIDENSDIITFAGSSDDKELAKHRNISGECMAAMTAMSYAKSIGLDSVSICHDYMGVGLWATGDWKTNHDYTRNYSAYAKEISKSVKVNFVKVEAHDNDVANEAVDGLAKYEVGLEHKQVRYRDLSQILYEMRTDYEYEKLDNIIFEK